MISAEPSPPVADRCPRCDYSYDRKSVPGGLCPRCLLLGIHNEGFGGGQDDEDCVPEGSLEDDELAAELPNFDFEEHIGRGGASVVWKARERVLNRHVAIKFLRNVRNDAKFVERFTREAHVMAQLNHPNIVTLFSFGRTRSNHCYLVMEMVDGVHLGELVSKGPLDVADALSITHEVCVAVRHAHDAGFMHRDIKPGNVLIDRRSRIKVGDFGLARMSTDTSTSRLTRHGWAVGTPHYIAPEQARGDGTEDRRADIYSIGVMLYQMLTGELPRGIFGSPSSKRKLDRRLDTIVMKALQEEPDRRYQNVSELIVDLQTVRASLDPALQAEQKTRDHGLRWRRRFELALAISVSLVLGMVIARWVNDLIEVPRKSVVHPVNQPDDGGITIVQAPGLRGLSGLSVSRVARLQPPHLASGSRFGSAVASHNGWLAIGAPDDWTQSPTDSGAVYLYRREKDRWTLQQRFANPHRDSHSRFGHAVAMDGRKLVVGSIRKAGFEKAAGYLDLYELRDQESQWSRIAESNDGGLREATPGLRVNISGDRIMASDHLHRKAAIFSNFIVPTQPGTWRAQGTLQSDESSRLGPFAFLSPDEWIANVCDPGNEGLLTIALGTGTDATGSLVRLSPPGMDAVGPTTFTDVTASRDFAGIGNSRWRNGDGLVWLLKRDGSGRYVHDGLVQPPADLKVKGLGKSVSISGAWAAISAVPNNGDEEKPGSVHLYHRTGNGPTAWAHDLFIPADPKQGMADFGSCVRLESQFLFVGAPASRGAALSYAESDERGTGAVFIYEFDKPLP